MHHPRRRPTHRLALTTCHLAPFAATAIIQLDGVHRRHVSTVGHSSTGQTTARGRGTLRQLVAPRSCGIRRHHRSRSRSMRGSLGSSPLRSSAGSESLLTLAGGIRSSTTKRSKDAGFAGIRTTAAWTARTARARSATPESTPVAGVHRTATIRAGQKAAARAAAGIRTGAVTAHLVVDLARGDPVAAPLRHPR